jgi:hypothetical protein
MLVPRRSGVVKDARLPDSPIPLISEWHDFYVLIGTVAATIIGAMFVVVSIATSYLTPEGAARSRTFLSPIVLHLSTVVLGCAAVMVPGLGPTLFAILFGVGGLIGFLYSTLIAARVRQSEVDLEDRIWYAAVPLISYLVMITAAVLVLRQDPVGLDTLAAANALLLVTGIRNAWDLTLFFAVMVKGQS